ncbi:Hpt domain-containing protein [Arthrobacter sp. EH-1B-1]|uniref:Hpt domain-containing protein n=1 Tax=Arthrobacter vasquezii TaxID=2977629 RepID=A0ABT6CZN9_9MICC|nr:Hpt domain-containing protein [Arthrobacter vasquezii]MDF9278937.1 Hpt domain-containing protein [Arthrobacter vasquezii]
MTAHDLPPLLDLTQLWAMESDFPSPEPVHRFVEDFILIWNDRLVRLRNALAEGDHPAAVNVLLGIKVSAVMIGATQLKYVAEAIESELRQGTAGVTKDLLDALAECGTQTIHQLSRKYLHRTSLYG